MAVKTYDPKSVQVIIGGVQISGFADGTFLSIERDEDAFTKVTGADGETSRAKSNNKAGMFTLTLQQTSASNDVLTGFALADELNNDGVVPVLIKDNLGTTTVFTANGWVRRLPTAEFAKEITNREWTLDLADMTYFVGGNS
jgi:hypothetical protein